MNGIKKIFSDPKMQFFFNTYFILFLLWNQTFVVELKDFTFVR